MKHFFQPTEWITNKKWLKDFDTAISFIFAYLVAFILAGVFGGFDTEMVLSWELHTTAVGVFAGREIITRKGAVRGAESGREQENYLEELKENKKSSKKINEHGPMAIREINKRLTEEKKKDKYYELKAKYQERISVLKPFSDYYKDYPPKWYQLLKKRKVRKNNKKVLTLKNKEKNLDVDSVKTNFEPLSLDDIKNADKSPETVSLKKRFNRNAEKSVQRMMRFSNLMQTVFFWGFQFAIFVNIFAYGFIRLMVLIIILTASYIMTLFSSFLLSYKIATETELADLKEKNELLRQVLQIQDEIKSKQEKIASKQLLNDNAVNTNEEIKKGES